MMGYSLNAEPREMPLRYYLLALCVCGVHALATAADYDADRAAGHRTLAVAFGRRAAAAFAFAAFLAAWLFGDFTVPCGFILSRVLRLHWYGTGSAKHRYFGRLHYHLRGFIVAAICHIIGL